MRNAGLPDNEDVKRLRQPLNSSTALAAVVTFGVVASGALDWWQGEAPASRVPGISGFVPFLLLSIVCMAAAIYAADVRRSPQWRTVSLFAAMGAAALADPTYATLIAAVPLIEISRRADEPERSMSIVGSGAFLGWLAITEPSAPQTAAFESVLVLLIVMTIVVMFGTALRSSDRARILEARLARVDERSSIASDIHDSLGHNLLATSIQLQKARALIDDDPEAAAVSIDLASGAVAEALADTRLVVDDNRADSGSFSLESSLEGLVSRMTTSEIPVSLDMRGDHRKLASVEQMTLYRFAQETLANVMRHSGASRAAVRASVIDGTATVSVQDDGSGFDVRSVPERTGLANLRERLARHGGTMQISSSEGGGTTVTALLEVAT